MAEQEQEKPPKRFIDSVKQSIKEEVEQATSSVDKGHLFLKWVLTKVFDASEDDADNQIVNGANDQGIDAFLEAEGGEGGLMKLFQVKYGKSHKREAIFKFKEDVQKFLKMKPREILRKDLQDILINIRDKKLEVEAVYVTDQEEDFNDTETLKVYGFQQLVDKLWDELTAPADGKVDKIKLEKYIKYDNTILGVVSLGELAHFVNRTRRYIFESNIRKFLKGKTKVNRNLRETLSEEPENVFYYNNGITLVVKKFKELEDSMIELVEPQIVNGAQTSSTIAEELRMDPDVKGSISISIINESTKTTRNQITRFRNSQNAVRGKDLISLEKFHTSIHGQLKNLGYYYEQQAGSWLNMNDEERNRHQGNTIFNNYLSKKSAGYKIVAKDAIQAMVAGIIQDPTTPYGSVGKFMPEGKHYPDVFNDRLADDYRLLFYPYLVKSYSEKEFGYGKRDVEPNEKKYARLLFVTAYFRILKDYILRETDDIKKDPKILDPIFKDFDTNKRLLKLTDEILNHFFVVVEDSHKDKMTLHTFFAKYVWGEPLQKKFISLANRNKELNDVKRSFKSI